MRKMIVLIGLLVALGLMASAVLAHHGDGPPQNPHSDGVTQEQWDDDALFPPAHGHMLVIGLELDPVTGEPIGFRKCVDLAAGEALPNPNQHNHLHVGPAGAALFEKAGNAVVPTAPLSPFADCAALEAFFGL